VKIILIPWEEPDKDLFAETTREASRTKPSKLTSGSLQILTHLMPRNKSKAGLFPTEQSI
jgi:hypothetical protein